jgi:hypothetical protein
MGLRSPLVRTVCHDFDRVAGNPNVDFLNFVRVPDELSGFNRSLGGGLRKLTEREAFGEGAPNA